MKASLYQYRDGIFNRQENSQSFDEAKANLVLCFGAKSVLEGPDCFNKLKDMFPVAEIAMCSTAGEILNAEVFDDTVSVTPVLFEKTEIKSQSVKIEDYPDSFSAGVALINKFDHNDLGYVFILSDGSKVNGSELVRGVNSVALPGLIVTGGLAGDGSNFQSTLIGLNAPPTHGLILGIGFYGSNLKVHHGSQGGWEMFGLEKAVTRSKENVLYEIDNKNALELYKKYLGNEAESLPGSALLFPLSVVLPDTGEQVVRTILSINEEDGSMTFAGDIPQGAQVRFMKANFDKITNAASGAALQSLADENSSPVLAVLISCVGRKLILQSRVDEEVTAVDEIFKHKTLLTGFYSYGEISPILPGSQCQLHNQTITITAFDEVE